MSKKIAIIGGSDFVTTSAIYQANKAAAEIKPVKTKIPSSSCQKAHQYRYKKGKGWLCSICNKPMS